MGFEDGMSRTARFENGGQGAKHARTNAPAEGSWWEIAVFIIGFVIVFCVVARSHAHAAAPRATSRERHHTMAQDGRESKRSTGAGHSDSAVSTSRASSRASSRPPRPARESTPSARTSLKHQERVSRASGRHAVLNTTSSTEAPAAEVQPGSTPSTPWTSAEASSARGANLKSSLQVRGSPSPEYAYTRRLTVETIQSLNPDETTQYSGWYRLTLGITHVPSGFGAIALFGMNQAYSRVDEGQPANFADDPIVAVTKAWNRERNDLQFLDTVTVGFRGSLPGNHMAGMRKFQGSVGPSIALRKVFGRFAITPSARYTRQFFSDEVGVNGAPNSPDILRGAVDTSLEIVRGITASLGWAYVNLIGFDGEQRGVERAALGLSWDVGPELNVALTAGSEAMVYNDENGENLLRFYNPRSGLLMLDFNFNF